jgi:hypothetical protein
LTADVRVPNGATTDEAEAIVAAIATILRQRPAQDRSVTIERSKWAAAARREALDDRV